ncbi:MAG: hypothetical protein PUF79_00015 [Lactobacillaceae bacterium]|nr:hypothetical protein [Lactobacillaceae bacterium]
MFNQFITRAFIHRLLISDGALVIFIILYNLLAMLIPVVKLTWWVALIVFILINVILIGLKVIIPLINQRQQP